MPKAPGETKDVRSDVVDKLIEFIGNVQPATLAATGIGGLILVAILLLYHY